MKRGAILCNRCRKKMTAAVCECKRNMVGKFPKDFLFIDPVTGSGYRLRYLSEV